MSRQGPWVRLGCTGCSMRFGDAQAGEEASWITHSHCAGTDASPGCTQSHTGCHNPTWGCTKPCQHGHPHTGRHSYTRACTTAQECTASCGSTQPHTSVHSPSQALHSSTKAQAQPCTGTQIPPSATQKVEGARTILHSLAQERVMHTLVMHIHTGTNPYTATSGSAQPPTGMYSSLV